MWKGNTKNNVFLFLSFPIFAWTHIVAVEATCKNAAMNSQTAMRGLIAHGKNRHRDTDNRRKSKTSVKTGQVISAVYRKADGRTDRHKKGCLGVISKSCDTYRYPCLFIYVEFGEFVFVFISNLSCNFLHIFFLYLLFPFHVIVYLQLYSVFAFVFILQLGHGGQEGQGFYSQQVKHKSLV